MHAYIGLPLVAAMAVAAQAPASSLAGLRDRARPLLIFAAPTDPQRTQQLEMLRLGIAALHDRSVVVICVPRGTHPINADEVPQASLNPEEESALRRRFGVVPGHFTAVLIGKDGGEKLRSHTAVTLERLTQSIDAMPMRKEEMGRR